MIITSLEEANAPMHMPKTSKPGTVPRQGPVRNLTELSMSDVTVSATTLNVTISNSELPESRRNQGPITITPASPRNKRMVEGREAMGNDCAGTIVGEPVRLDSSDRIC